MGCNEEIGDNKDELIARAFNIYPRLDASHNYISFHYVPMDHPYYSTKLQLSWAAATCNRTFPAVDMAKKLILEPLYMASAVAVSRPERLLSDEFRSFRLMYQKKSEVLKSIIYPSAP